MIANESGDNTTPSWVCYPDVGQRRVGKAAERAGTKYAGSVIYHSKRLIGCKYGEKVLQDCKASSNLSYLGIIGPLSAQFVLLNPFHSKNNQIQPETNSTFMI